MFRQKITSPKLNIIWVFFFLKGVGTSQNLKEANIWFSKAREQGVREATENLLILSRVKGESAEALSKFEFQNVLGFAGD